MMSGVFLWICWGCLVLAALPALVFTINLCFFQAPRKRPDLPEPKVSVLIPARDEEANMPEVLASVAASTEVDLEILVLDDQSTDATAALVEAFARTDARVRLLRGQPLPEGWAGKMFACWQLAGASKGDWLVFLDADVRLAQDAVRRMVDHARTSPIRPALVSGVPRQITGSWLERLLIPLIDFILLGYLPLWVMRWWTDPSLAAAVGQLVLVERARYWESGGHEAIRGTFHDGLNLPRLFRRNGQFTDLTDISRLAECRMYHNAREVWNGLLKNAGEGLGAPGVIGPMTVLLLGGHVVPWVLLGWGWADPGSRTVLLAACFLGWLPRLFAAARFRQSWIALWLHPLGVLVMQVIQWTGFFRMRRGLRTTWKGRESVA